MATWGLGGWLSCTKTVSSKGYLDEEEGEFCLTHDDFKVLCGNCKDT